MDSDRAKDLKSCDNSKKSAPKLGLEAHVGKEKGSRLRLTHVLGHITKYGDACDAAAFLGQFVGDAKWAHLDIAGTEMFEKPTEFTAEGSSGFGVRLLATYLMNLAGK